VVFLELAMKRMGFADKWVYLVMTCVSLVTYSILINGNPVGLIKPSRGIRQRDHMSPYLFLLCVEVLSGLLQQAEARGVITGVPSSPKGPKISHLFFVDDSLLFCKANIVEWKQLLRILGIYEAGSSQKLNMQKTSVFFSRNTSLERHQEIIHISGLSEAHRIDSYLGLPSFVGKYRN
jgi:ribosome-associated protein YbcJ (S4-like RNA binding protein)